MAHVAIEVGRAPRTGDTFFLHTRFGLLNISAMKEDFEKHPDLFKTRTVPLTEVGIDVMRASNGPEDGHLERMRSAPSEALRKEPVIFGYEIEGSNMVLWLLDGIHRILTLYERGDRTIVGYGVDVKHLPAWQVDLAAVHTLRDHEGTAYTPEDFAGKYVPPRPQ